MSDTDRERAREIAQIANTTSEAWRKHHLADAIASALASVRAETVEQCAKIADEMSGWSQAGDKRAHAIASAIRHPRPSQDRRQQVMNHDPMPSRTQSEARRRREYLCSMIEADIRDWFLLSPEGRTKERLVSMIRASLGDD